MGVLDMLDFGAIAGVAAILLVGYAVGNAVYYLYIHPLAKFPGPISHKISNIPYFYYNCIGKLPFHVAELHKKYGPIVRVNTYSLDFTDSNAWKDIMGHRNGLAEMQKFRHFYNPNDEPANIVTAPTHQHAALRKLMAHSFSDKSLRKQEPIIMKYVHKLINALDERSEGGKETVDVNSWFNYCTFDIIGDLSFGDGFGFIEDPRDGFLKSLIKNSGRAAVMFAARHYPIVGELVLWYLSKTPGDMEVMFEAGRRMGARLQSGEKRPDFLQPLLDGRESLGLSVMELFSNVSVLIAAGSETVGTLLIGLTWYLNKNPKALKKLQEEIRGRYNSEFDIDFASIDKLPYLNACLDEALRLFPPSPSALPRVVPKGGAPICGTFIPEDTVVQIFQYAMHRDERNFAEPHEFRPERWMEDPAFNDDLKASQPFHLGPRGCVGKHLARLEMGAALCHLIYKFDMELEESYDNWLDQKVWDVWSRNPLKVRLTPAAH